MPSLKDKIFYGCWRCIIFLLNVHSTILDCISLLKNILNDKFSKKCNVIKFLHEIKKLSKLPQHVTLVFQHNPNENNLIENSNFVDLGKISEKLAYLVGAGVTTVTLYDVNGILKSSNSSSSLKTRFEEKFQIFLSKASFGPSTPIISHIIWHNPESESNCHKMNFNTPTNGLTSGYPANIFITSYSDGKPKFLEMIKNGAIMERQVKVSPVYAALQGHPVGSRYQDETLPLIDKNMVNEYLKPRCCTNLEQVGYKGWKLEPDLLISYGRRQTTTSFLPWHTRLTDIHWIKREGANDLLQVLREFAKCKHRYGK